MIQVPKDATIRLAWNGGWTVNVARPGAPLDIRDECSTPGLTALITHGPGRSWPDLAGERLATETLALGGNSVVFLFADLAGALACRKRLEGGRQ